ncbi:MAG: GT2 family glycosyltransferase [Bacteroidia bacterium]|jgi:GT2 family glycosyltransferase
MEVKKDGISVIVCCYNSSARIILTLEHLVAQQVSANIAWEIILIDNNSSDGTGSISEVYMEKQSTTIPFSIVSEPNPGLSNARNKGFAEAKYEIVLMVDDDNSLAPNYIEGIYRGFENQPNTGMVGGLGFAALEADPPEWFNDYAYCFAVGEQNPKQHLYGAGLGLRMTALEKLRRAGFQSLLSDRTGDNLMSGGDTELCLAFRMAGYELKYNPSLTFKHHLPDTRINWAYLKRLFNGFGMSKARMDIYTTVMANRPIPKRGKLPVWFDRSLYLITDLFRHFPLVLKSSLFLSEGDTRVLTTIAKLGQIRGIYAVRENYENMFKQVQQLSKNLANE